MSTGYPVATYVGDPLPTGWRKFTVAKLDDLYAQLRGEHAWLIANPGGWRDNQRQLHTVAIEELEAHLLAEGHYAVRRASTHRSTHRRKAPPR